jgi:hypothetical protein
MPREKYYVVVVVLQEKEKPKIFEDRFWSIEYPQGLRKGEKNIAKFFSTQQKKKVAAG